MSSKNRLILLRCATTKKDIANLLGLNISFLTKVLYVYQIENQYYQFKIQKRSGGSRIINAPSTELKDIQSRLANLLLDCVDEINLEKKITLKLSHGFVRNRSIITNAEKHKNNKNVLNLDIKDFFDSFNFGRVRGFFIKNKNFELHTDIATLIAKIACLDNKLPQGSPCSPVISNLITHSLDVRLVLLCKTYGLTYSRYADDLTFSTRKTKFPEAIAFDTGNNKFKAGKKLRKEIGRAGFEINHKKTRLQFKNSRQDVTGLVVNKKINIKSEYWRTARAMCHKLFMSGQFFEQTDKGPVLGKVEKLDGMLSFIDSIDKYNHHTPKGNSKPTYAPFKFGLDHTKKLNVREKTYSKYLFYSHFYANKKPTILCEGKTDNIYLKCAIQSLAAEFPKLAKAETKTAPYQLLVNFLNYNSKTKHLLDLSGGTSYLYRFLLRYSENFNHYKAPKPKNPVILLLDNDDGPKEILNTLRGTKFPNCPDNIEIIRKLKFLHITANLYIILTPLKNEKFTAMEDFFDEKTLKTVLETKTFNPKNDTDTPTQYGKHVFSTKVVKAQKNDISFKLFTPILEQIVDVMMHYEKTTLRSKN